MRWNTQDLTRALRQVTLISVPLAEFEYLYDPQWKVDGEIDPNVMSAGGFPVVVLRRILDLLAESRCIQWKPEQADDSVKELATHLRQTFSGLSFELSLTLAQRLLHLLSALENEPVTLKNETVSSFLRQLILVYQEIKTVRPDLNTIEFLEQITVNMATLSRVCPEIWLKWRKSLVAELWNVTQTGEAIVPFRNDILKSVWTFLEYFVESSGLQTALTNDSVSIPVTIFKVEWEADLGYAAAWLLQRLRPELNVQVKLDLFINTGFVSEIPLAALEVVLSKRQKRQLSRLLQNPQLTQGDEKISLNSQNDTSEARIEWNHDQKKSFLVLNSDGQLVLPTVSPTQECFSTIYNADAFAWNYSQVSELNFADLSQRYLYLANILNAKAATLAIYETMEEKLGCGHRHPPSQIVPLSNNVSSIWQKSAFVLKEGGRCSAGGRDVDLLETRQFQVAVLQSQVESHLWKYQGRELHGHIRCVSILNPQGKICRVGFVVKLSTKEKENSSAYLSFRLFFDPQGQFIYGSEVTPQGIHYFSDLSAYGLEPILTIKELQNLFKAVYRNWLVSMLYLNEFWSSEPGAKIAWLVAQGYVLPSFAKNVTFLPQKRNRHTLTLIPVRGKKYGKGDLWQPQPLSIKAL